MSGPVLLNRLLLLTILAILQPVAATTSSSDPSLSYDGHGPLSDITPGNDSGTGTSSSGKSSVDVIGSQPMTVQLGAGFIVGCVFGVIVYGTTRIGLRVAQRRERRTRDSVEGEREREEAVLVDV